MAIDLKQSGSSGSRDRMRKMTSKAYKNNIITEVTTKDGREITYRDTRGKKGTSLLTKRGGKSVRLEKDAEGKTYKTKTRNPNKKADGPMALAKKEISQKKYDRNMRRIEKVKSKGASVRTGDGKLVDEPNT